MSIVSGRKCDHCDAMIQNVKDYWRAEQNSNGCRHPTISWDFCTLGCLRAWSVDRYAAEEDAKAALNG